MSAKLKCASNGKTSHNILVKVKTNVKSDECVDALAGWMARVVSQTYPVSDWAYPHMVVAGTLHCNYDDDETDSLRNEVLVAVRETTPDTIQGSVFLNSEFTDLVCRVERNNPPATLNADVLAKTIDDDEDAPGCIDQCGVSGVSDAMLSEVWREIVSQDRNWMDGSGEGVMLHPMWMWNIRNGAHTIREMSFNFGWGNFTTRRT